MSRSIQTGPLRRSRAAPAHPPRTCRLTLETLEARITPQAVTTSVVNFAQPGAFSTTYSAAAQALPGVTALVAANDSPPGTVNEGVVTFSVLNTNHIPLEDSHGNLLTASASVIAGAATTSFPLPAGLPVGVYTIFASYSDPGGPFFDALTGDLPAVLTVAPATPIVTVTDASGDYTGSPFKAQATVNGAASLEGIAPTLSYYSGDFTLDDLTGQNPPTPLSGNQNGAENGVPVAAGQYTVLASYPGSLDYTSTQDATSFTIFPRPPTISISANDLMVDGQGVLSTSANRITLSQINDPFPNALVTVTATYTNPATLFTTLLPDLKATVVDGAWSVVFQPPSSRMQLPRGIYTFTAAQTVDGVTNESSASASIDVVNPLTLGPGSNSVAADSTISLDPGFDAANLAGTDANNDSVAIVLAVDQLTNAPDSATLLVYRSEPASVAANAQASDADGLFFDVRITNPGSPGNYNVAIPVKLTLQSSLFNGMTLSQASAALHFFDPITGVETPLTPPDFKVVALLGDTIFIDVYHPEILTKTVFAITLLSSTSTTTGTITPSQAAAGANGTASDSPAGTSTTVTFVSAAQVGGLLAASADSVSVSGAAQGSQSTTAGALFSVTGARAAALASTPSGGDDSNNDSVVDGLWQWLLQDGGLLKLWLGRAEQEPLWRAAPAPAPDAAAGVLLEGVSIRFALARAEHGLEQPAEAAADLVEPDLFTPSLPGAPSLLDLFPGGAARTAREEMSWALLAGFAALQPPDCQAERRERAARDPGSPRDRREGRKVP